MNGVGLVFAGGGGKGAYEIGVWKYLREIGFDKYIKVISGTSIGALNAALFAGSDYETAEKVWLNIDKDKLVSPKKITTEDVMKWLNASGIGNTIPLPLLLGGLFAGQTGGENNSLDKFLSSLGENSFSRESLTELINEGINFEQLQNTDVECYVTCVRAQGLGIERFKLNNYSKEDIIKLLLASSAMPIISENVDFNGVELCDGGVPIFGDNVPVKPVYETGARNIIVVHLGRQSVIDKEQYPNAIITEIRPSENLGDMITGTLDFSAEGAFKRMQLGYEDAKAVMQSMFTV